MSRTTFIVDSGVTEPFGTLRNTLFWSLFKLNFFPQFLTERKGFIIKGESNKQPVKWENVGLVNVF